MALDQEQSSPLLSELSACSNWNQVVALFERAEKRAYSNSPGDAATLLDIRPIVCGFCPKHDFARDSVQKRLIYFLGASAEAAFKIQETTRLFLGFGCAIDSIFGPGWRKDLTRLKERYLIWETEQFAVAPKLVSNIDPVLFKAFWQGDSQLFEEIAAKFRTKQAAYAAFISSPSTPTRKPKLDVRTEIYRNWTNPDLPLWLMQDKAMKQALRYATGGQFIDNRAIQQRVARTGLKRSLRRPIRAMIVRKNADDSILDFTGFEYSVGVGDRMHNVKLAPGYGETYKWVIGGLPGYIST